MRHIYQGTFKDANGNVVGSSTTSDGNAGSVAVYLAGGTTAASVYEASSGGTAVNSVSTDSYGHFYFYVDDTDYTVSQLFKIILSHRDVKSKTYDNIRILPLVSLLSVTTISLAANGDTTIFTVPTGKRCFLTYAVLVAGGDAGATTTISIGANGTETDFIPANTLSNLDAEYDAVMLMPVPNTTPTKMKTYAAGTVIQAQVANESGTTGNTLYLYGHLY